MLREYVLCRLFGIMYMTQYLCDDAERFSRNTSNNSKRNLPTYIYSSKRCFEYADKFEYEISTGNGRSQIEKEVICICNCEYKYRLRLGLLWKRVSYTDRRTYSLYLKYSQGWQIFKIFEISNFYFL